MTEQIAVVDDNEAVCKALSRLLNGYGYTVDTYTSAGEFLEQAANDEPSCAILDVRMPGIGGLQLQEILIARKWYLPVIFISGHGDIPCSVKAMKKGAVDFLQKPVTEQDLLASVQEAVAIYRKHMDDRRENQVTEAAISSLTNRELEIFRYIITGKLNKQIAYDLHITEKTVKVHRAHVKQKLHVKSIVELIRIADKAHIAPIPLA